MPDNRVWCLTGAEIRPGENYGPVRLFVGNRILMEANCQPGTCQPSYRQVWTPEEIAIREGRTLGDYFECDADLSTPGMQQCTPGSVPEGAFIEIGIEVFPAP